MASAFTEAQTKELYIGEVKANEAYINLLQRFLVRTYKHDQGREHALHGFSRRLGTLNRAIRLAFNLLPPELDAIPERDTVVDATLAIQAFVLNTFGCLDNLAWIWVYEKAVKNPNGSELDPQSVSLGSKAVRATFSKEFNAYIDSRNNWFQGLKNFRDALAHRIPLYVPPYIITPDLLDDYNRLGRESETAMRARDVKEFHRLQSERDKLGRFRPWMTHSRTEQSASIVFHPQLLADFNTIDEFGGEMLKELDR